MKETEASDDLLRELGYSERDIVVDELERME